MIELYGDFFELADKHSADVLVCTINSQIKKNGALVMGAGIALAFRNRFKDLDMLWGDQRQQKPEGILITYSILDRLSLIGLPTKTDWRQPSDIKLIKKSIGELVTFADHSGCKRIFMTRPGCGNGGLDWTFVKSEIGHYLDNRFFIVEKNKW